jgi:hypothetical protein
VFDDGRTEVNALEALTPPIALMMKALSASETSVNFNEATRRNVPEGCHLHSPAVTFGIGVVGAFDDSGGHGTNSMWAVTPPSQHGSHCVTQPVWASRRKQFTPLSRTLAALLTEPSRTLMGT